MWYFNTHCIIHCSHQDKCNLSPQTTIYSENIKNFPLHLKITDGISLLSSITLIAPLTFLLLPPTLHQPFPISSFCLYSPAWQSPFYPLLLLDCVYDKSLILLVFLCWLISFDTMSSSFKHIASNKRNSSFCGQVVFYWYNSVFHLSNHEEMCT